MKKILVIPGTSLYPMDSGGAFGQLSYLKVQQHQLDITIFVTPRNITYQHVDKLKALLPAIKIVPIGFGSQKKVSNFFKKEARKHSGKDYAYQFRKTPYIGGSIFGQEHIINEMVDYLQQHPFDLIQVEHLQNLSLATILPDNVKKIFVHHEIGFTRIEQDLASLNYSAAYIKYIATAARSLETEWLKMYDGVIVFNDEDASLLRSLGVNKPFQTASAFPLQAGEVQNIYDANATPQLLFIGGESHYPNKEGLTWFFEEVYPLIKSADVTIKIVSSWSEEFQKKYKSDKVVFTGFADDLDPLLRTAVCVVPIRIGSGIRIKVISSMAKGIPVVSTTLGASGIEKLVHGHNIMLADDAGAFAGSVISLLENAALRRVISENTFALASDKIKQEDFVERRNRFYDEV